MSTDNQYHLKIIRAAITGVINDSLANTVVGRVAHARWSTNQSRTIRLYVSTLEPSHELLRVVNYIV